MTGPESAVAVITPARESGGTLQVCRAKEDATVVCRAGAKMSVSTSSLLDNQHTYKPTQVQTVPASGALETALN